MKKLIIFLLMSSLVLVSCRSITVEQAANGKAKCGKRLK